MTTSSVEMHGDAHIPGSRSSVFDSHVDRVGNAAMLTLQQKLQILHDTHDSVCISLRFHSAYSDSSSISLQFHGAEEVWPNHCHMPCAEHVSDQKRLGLLAHPIDRDLTCTQQLQDVPPHLFPWAVRRLLLQESIPIGS